MTLDSYIKITSARYTNTSCLTEFWSGNSLGTCGLHKFNYLTCHFCFLIFIFISRYDRLCFILCSSLFELEKGYFDCKTMKFKDLIFPYTWISNTKLLVCNITVALWTNWKITWINHTHHQMLRKKIYVRPTIGGFTILDPAVNFKVNYHRFFPASVWSSFSPMKSLLLVL